MKSDSPIEHTPEQKLNMSTMMLSHSTDKVNKAIDDLTSASLKRVLKLATNIHLAEALLGRDAGWYINLAEKEQNLIDLIFSHQELTMGHQALDLEVKNEEQVGESGLGQVDLTTSLEENNHE